MKQRIFGAIAALGLLAGVVAGPALAGTDGVQRYQVATTSYTVTVLDTYIHTFVVSVNPCDVSIAITGSTPVDSGYYATETVTGTLTDGVISFTSTYDGPYSPGFVWSGSFPVAGGPLSGLYTGTVEAAPTTFSTYKNHGDYVSSMGGGPDAAHSCIGKPITSRIEPVGGAIDAEPASDKDEASDEASGEAREHHSPKVSTTHHAWQADGGGARPDHPKHPKHPKKPSTSASAKDHSNHGNHTGRP